MLPRGHSIRNRLLTVIDSSDLKRLLPSLEEVPLALGQALEVPGKPISQVYLIQSGLVSVLAISGRNRCIEFGMIGPEGMTGFAAILDDDRSANQIVVQGAGTALRTSSARCFPVLPCAAAYCASCTCSWPRRAKRPWPTDVPSWRNGLRDGF